MTPKQELAFNDLIKTPSFPNHNQVARQQPPKISPKPIKKKKKIVKKKNVVKAKKITKEHTESHTPSVGSIEVYTSNSEFDGSKNENVEMTYPGSVFDNIEYIVVQTGELEYDARDRQLYLPLESLNICVRYPTSVLEHQKESFTDMMVSQNAEWKEACKLRREIYDIDEEY